MKMPFSATFATLVVFLLPVVALAQVDWTSARVQFDANGRLVYPADAQDNRIPDYSNAGYRGGGVPLPTVPVVLTISPIAGDNTANIQAAIDSVGAMAVQSDGYRGTVLLTAGTYRIDGTIRLNKSGVTDANVWNPGEIDIRYHRYITAISGNTIAIDAPVFNHLERSLSQSFIYRYDPAAILRNIGVEKLLVDIVTAGPDSENHATDAITFVGAEDSWLRDATMQHFVHAGVQFTNATRCTVERARAIDPHSIVTGERRYNFSTYHAQLILFRDSFASYARHAFVTNGTSTDSGSVALHSTVDHNLTFAEAHRRWSTGLLFDGLNAVNRASGDVFGFYNRGNYGTGHGWATGHSVIWNSDAAGGRILVQKPPTAQNYAIGSFGNVSGAGPWAGAPGYQEGSNTPGLEPPSLYLEQVAQRQSNVAPPDVTAPSAPTLSSTASDSTSVGLAWTASVDDVAVDGYDVFKDGAFVGFSSGTTFTVSGLSGGTPY